MSLGLGSLRVAAQNTTPPEAPPRSSQPASAPAPAAGAGQQPPQQPPPSGQEPGTDSGTFVFHSDVQEVLLHATVIDDKQRIITNLEQNAFTVFEDGKPQVIKSFRHEDIPISLGIVIDNSGSMREKRAKVAKAAVNLIRASNPQDEVFVVNFSDEYYLDQPFTNRINLLQDALEKYETRGGTALYDAVVASADELKKHGKLQKKILFVVTDGEDDASRESLEQAVRRLQEENGPTVYAIGLLGEERQRRAKRALETMAERTGGIAFFPRTLDEVDAISSTVARDIRNQYTLGYKPTTPKSAGGYRTIRVDARGRGY
ncbi:MAG TPA: VWA domain-containing protein, partial [Terriglobales bacterium]|nr:VWA domain-containing protein [Terriglobales bacterium]